MAMATDESFLRENGFTDTVGPVLASSSSSSSSSLAGHEPDVDDVLDYNVAFPQLTSTGPFDQHTGSSFFTSASFSSPANEHTTASLNTKKIDEDRRRKMAIHEKSATTKIIEIPPEERLSEKVQRNGAGHPSSRSSSNGPTGQALQKLCTRIQKETSTNITFFNKDQTLIVTITGRPEHVRAAQVQIVRELQQPVKLAVNVPFDYHRYIIGPRAATLKQIELETLTRIAIPAQTTQSNTILITGAKDNVKLAEQRILNIYQTQFNKGYERLLIPCLYHPWIRHHLVKDMKQQFNVTIDLPPPFKPIDEVAIRGERQPVEQVRMRVLQFYQALEGKIMTFPLEIPCEQHRFILGKKGAGLKEIFEKTNAVVRVPKQEDSISTIHVMGEAANIGEAITMIYKMANALTAVHIKAPHWMHSVVKGERSANIELIRKNHPDVAIYFRDDNIDIEGPPEQVEPVRSQIQAVIDDLRDSNTTYLEVEIDPQHYHQLIGKNQIHLGEIQDQTGCDIKFPQVQLGGRHVKLMGSQASVEKAKQILLERTQKLANERTTTMSIDPQYYPQIIGVKGKKLEELRAKFHNIQIRFPPPDAKSDKVTLQGDKEDVEKCLKFLQQKIKDLYSVEFELSRRLYPLLIGKAGANIQRLRDQMPDVRVDVPVLDETKEVFPIRLSGKKIDVDKARKLFDERAEELNQSLENSQEQYVTTDPKWHGRFFLNNRKLITELQKQYGDVQIKLPERKSQSDQILLRGPKQSIEQVQKNLEELVEKWENTVTKEMAIPHRHHGYLLAQGGSYIQPIQKEFNVQIKFPLREKEGASATKDDTVRVIGRADDVDKAIVALEKMVPVETTLDIPYEAHGFLVGKGGSHLQVLIAQYPDVQITFPPVKSTSNIIRFKGQSEQVEGFKQALVESYEKYQADKEARSFEVRFTIKPEYRGLVSGNRRRTINNLREKYNVNIQITDSQAPPSAVVPTPSATNEQEEAGQQQQDDQQAIPHDQPAISTEASGSTDIEIIITGYEARALACRDEILRLVDEFESKITMEIDIDHRIHARIIGSGGQKLQVIMKEYEVEIKFPTNNKSDQVHVIGLNQEKIDSCIDHLLTLEEDFLQDLPQKQASNGRSLADAGATQYPQQEVPSSNKFHVNKSAKLNKQHKQAPFKVKNAPWTAEDQNGMDHEEQSNEHSSRQRNGHHHHHQSPKKASTAPHPGNPDEYPAINNGLSSTTDENTAQAHEPTTVSTIPIIWGPAKRNK